MYSLDVNNNKRECKKQVDDVAIYMPVFSNHLRLSCHFLIVPATQYVDVEMTQPTYKETRLTDQST